MPSISFGVNIALQAVLANSQAIEITEHNVANASTPGYRRQAPVLTASVATSPYGIASSSSAGQMGSGVIVAKVQRFNLDFFDTRFRSVSAETSNWKAQSSILSQVEATLGETSDGGMLPRLDQFWTDWQNLASDPSNMSLRTNLLDNARNLSDGFNERWQQLNQLRSDQNLAVNQKVADINSAAQEVANLNAEISRVMSVDEQPNDLLDQRDQLLDQLASLTGAVSYQQKNGEVVVSVGGHVLVTGNSAVKLTTRPKPGDTGVDQVVWADDPSSVMTPPSGELKGIMEARDQAIPQQIDGLNQLASQLAVAVNTLHRSGYGIDNPSSTGLDFFSGDTSGVINAATIHVNTAVTASSLATANATGQPGNSEIANAIAALKDQKTMDGGTNTFNDFYNSQITRFGQAVASASTNYNNHQLVAQALSDQRESASGVSLDEEAANLATYQRGYQAAARVMNVYDDLLNTIINGMGLVGRS